MGRQQLGAQVHGEPPAIRHCLEMGAAIHRDNNGRSMAGSRAVDSRVQPSPILRLEGVQIRWRQIELDGGRLVERPEDSPIRYSDDAAGWLRPAVEEIDETGPVTGGHPVVHPGLARDLEGVTTVQRDPVQVALD